MPLAPGVRRTDPNHDCNFGRGQADYATGSESTAQRVRSALLEILGEWFMDVTKGMPWYRVSADATDILPIMGGDGPPDIGYAEASAKAVILSVDGVARISSFDVNFDHVTRKLAMSVVGIDVDGGAFTVALQDPGP